MKTLRACAGLLAVLLAIGGIGIVGGMSSAAALGGPDSISGTATDDAGNPVAGVEVGVYYMQEELIGSVTTGADGTYSVDGLTPGEYYDVRFGFNDPYLYADQAIKSVQVIEGAGAVADVVVHVGGQIAGTVRGSDGQPVGSAIVTARRADGAGGDHRVTADASGAYALRGLPVGDYRLEFVSYSGHLSEWYNDKASFEAADDVAVSVRETSSANAELTMGAHATGIVTRYDGSPFPGVYIEVVWSSPEGPETYTTTRTDEDGHYTTRWLEPGRYTIFALPRDGVHASASSDFTVTEGAGEIVRDLHLTLPSVGNLSLPTIEGGRSYVGDTLTATTGEWIGDGITYAFQWLRDGQPIDGATEATYVAAEADANHDVQVRVTASRDGYSDGVAESAAVAVTYGSLICMENATIVGEPKVGETLEVVPGIWNTSLEGMTFTYQWLVNGEPIDGATGTTLDVHAGYLGQALGVEIHAFKPTWEPGFGIASGTAPIAPGDLDLKPAVSGDVRIGNTLTASVDVPDGAEVTYSWQVRSPAAGSSSDTFKEVGAASSFTLADRYKNYALRLVVTVSATGYNDAAATVDISEQLR
ncbi:carboxypeptidase regulatory-like domain-containing protein [Nocardioides sp. NPDC000445]|uniref:carboxypeptidase regulatory-like domain-containing protein n=1 Tax=Nocardioides sp. NPDC000445 TaxID=3154257 RepID=UPI0033184B27